jgi:molybdenum cofactor synthesis domain-containing protein
VDRMTIEMTPNKLRVLAIYRAGKIPAFTVVFSKAFISAPSHYTVCLLPPTPKSLLSEDRISIILEHFPTDIDVENSEIAFVGSRVRFSSLKKFESGVISGYEASVRVPGVLGISARCSIERRVSCGVLTVSDKGSCGERTDLSGPALIAKCIEEGFCVVRYDVVPDDAGVIRETLSQWVREGVLLILSTGGTGLSLRDVTPDTMRAFSDFEIPGIGEMMRLQSMRFTPMAMLSRCGGFVSGKSVLLSLPGSERGAIQSFDAVRLALRHAVEIRNGWAGECSSIHHHFHREKQHGR